MTEAWENTLAGVYELALNNDPMLAMAEASYRVGLEQRKIARAALLPQANITYSDSESYSKSRGQFAIGTFIVENATNSGQDSDGYVASLTQPLFDLNAWFTFRSGSELDEAGRSHLQAGSAGPHRPRLPGLLHRTASRGESVSRPGPGSGLKGAAGAGATALRRGPGGHHGRL